MNDKQDSLQQIKFHHTGVYDRFVHSFGLEVRGKIYHTFKDPLIEMARKLNSQLDLQTSKDAGKKIPRRRR